MNLRDAVYTRRSVREFTTELLDEATLLRLLEFAVQAPSAVNQQPWSFAVVRDRGLMRRISEQAKSHMRVVAPGLASSPHFHELLSNPSFDIFYGAPALIVISSNAADAWAVENCALAAQNLMLAARAEGLGSCWIGFAQGWLRTPDGKASIGLDADWLPVAPIIVGHPKSEPAPVPRREPDVRWI